MQNETKPTAKQIERDVEHAQARQAALRKDAPSGVEVGKVWKSPRDRAVELHCPECADNKEHKATHTAFYTEKDNHRSALDQGYVPVIANGEQVQVGDDMLYTRPIEFQKALIHDASEKSKQRMKAAEDKESKAKGQALDESSVEVSKVKIK